MDDYRSRLRQVLDAHSAEVGARLRFIADAVTDDVRGVVLDVFTDQDGEGSFNVWARFDGPDFFALNKPIDAHRHLFGVVHGAEGWEPDVPFLPRSADQDVLVDTVADWLRAVWGEHVRGGTTTGWEVDSPDGLGTDLPRPLTHD
uniref:Uncharacterized protein n=1 Tax=Streptoalloteichus sp. ATCC 53650 TaxID=756733 RepID=K4NYL8_9PSEU|nr:hypothetical protein [Streptoalloteichus sp. ATCC 53650]